VPRVRNVPLVARSAAPEPARAPPKASSSSANAWDPSAFGGRY
jgi:hypothetical protein